MFGVLSVVHAGTPSGGGWWVVVVGVPGVMVVVVVMGNGVMGTILHCTALYCTV